MSNDHQEEQFCPSCFDLREFVESTGRWVCDNCGDIEKRWAEIERIRENEEKSGVIEKPRPVRTVDTLTDEELRSRGFEIEGTPWDYTFWKNKQIPSIRVAQASPAAFGQKLVQVRIGNEIFGTSAVAIIDNQPIHHITVAQLDRLLSVLKEIEGSTN